MSQRNILIIYLHFDCGVWFRTLYTCVNVYYDVHLRRNMPDNIDIILNKDLGTFSYEEKCNLKGKRFIIRI